MTNLVNARILINKGGFEISATQTELVEKHGYTQQESDDLFSQHETKIAKKQANNKIRKIIYADVADIDSLLGKTANFTAALASMQLDIMSKLATATSLADVRASVAEYIPFMQALQAKIEAGEILSVQSAQNASHEDAIFEGLEALTKVARIFEAQEETD